MKTAYSFQENNLSLSFVAEATYTLALDMIITNAN